MTNNVSRGTPQTDGEPDEFTKAKLREFREAVIAAATQTRFEILTLFFTQHHGAVMSRIPVTLEMLREMPDLVDNFVLPRARETAARFLLSQYQAGLLPVTTETETDQMSDEKNTGGAPAQQTETQFIDTNSPATGAPVTSGVTADTMPDDGVDNPPPANLPAEPPPVGNDPQGVLPDPTPEQPPQGGSQPTGVLPDPKAPGETTQTQGTQPGGGNGLDVSQIIKEAAQTDAGTAQSVPPAPPTPGQAVTVIDASAQSAPSGGGSQLPDASGDPASGQTAAPPAQTTGTTAEAAPPAPVTDGAKPSQLTIDSTDAAGDGAPYVTPTGAPVERKRGTERYFRAQHQLDLALEHFAGYVGKAHGHDPAALRTQTAPEAIFDFLKRRNPEAARVAAAAFLAETSESGAAAASYVSEVAEELQKRKKPAEG